MQNADPIRQGEDPVDVVFNEQDRVPPRKTADQSGYALAILLSKACQRLVEDQEGSIRGNRDRDLEEPALTMRKRLADLAGMVGETDVIEDRPGSRIGLAVDTGIPLWRS